MLFPHETTAAALAVGLGVYLLLPPFCSAVAYASHRLLLLLLLEARPVPAGMAGQPTWAAYWCPAASHYSTFVFMHFIPAPLTHFTAMFGGLSCRDGWVAYLCSFLMPSFMMERILQAKYNLGAHLFSGSKQAALAGKQ
jgi:hypothetical protein